MLLSEIDALDFCFSIIAEVSKHYDSIDLKQSQELETSFAHWFEMNAHVAGNCDRDARTCNSIRLVKEIDEHLAGM